MASTVDAALGVDNELALRMYARCCAFARSKSAANDCTAARKCLGWPTSIWGRRGSPWASCEALRRDDFITSTHRGHGHCLAKGADVRRMYAELLGKEDGYCRGKGGSMHIADFENGNLGANAIVGGSAGIATGAAHERQDARHRPGRGVLLRRRSPRPGAPVRGDEHGGALEPPRHLRL